MPRTAARFVTTMITSLMLLAMSAIPALAASGTKPDPIKDEFLVGSLPELGLAAAVGVGVGILGYLLLGKDDSVEDDGH